MTIFNVIVVVVQLQGNEIGTSNNPIPWLANTLELQEFWQATTRES